MQQAHLANILHFLSEPSASEEERSYEYFEKGLLVVEEGKVLALGYAKDLIDTLPSSTTVYDHKERLLLPGFIDTHVHFPQLEMIASPGADLLNWLNNYAFFSEEKYANADYASEQSDRFLDELLRVGTTTALVFGTVHQESVHSFFTSCKKKNLRMVCGKVMMDRNAPTPLLDTPQTSYDESKQLIETWHHKDRLRYAVTPRFAPTSSEHQLELAGQLLKEYPDVYLHTHLSESVSEIAWVRELYPERDNYVDVYDKAGLLGPKSVFAHCIHLADNEWRRLAETNCGVAFCPTSNLFLGSGLFSMKKAKLFSVKVGLGTDVGGGTSLSLLQTASEAYKVLNIRNEQHCSLLGLYLATLGGAKTLDLENIIGNFMAGKEADFVVIDMAPTKLMEHRITHCESLVEQLFVLTMLGDDRVVTQTWSGGVKVYDCANDIQI